MHFTGRHPGVGGEGWTKGQPESKGPEPLFNRSIFLAQATSTQSLVAEVKGCKVNANTKTGHECI